MNLRGIRRPPRQQVLSRLAIFALAYDSRKAARIACEVVARCEAMNTALAYDASTSSRRHPATATWGDGILTAER